jgi:hypothetical protein
VRARLDGAERHAILGGDLRIGEALQESLFHRRALQVRERADRAPHPRVLRDPEGAGVGIFDEGPRFVHENMAADRGLPVTPARAVDAQVSSQRGQPDPDRPSLREVLARPRPDDEKHVLKHVLGLLLVPQDAQRHAEEHRRIPRVELAERGPLPSRNPLESLGVSCPSRR